METNWFILIIVLVCAAILIFYLIKRNVKDKEDVVNFMNQSEIEDDTKLKEKEESLLK
ncbi:MAG: hypothetical protein WCG08_00185 [Paludibacter sp.]|jgi:hypothetical protein